MATKNRREWEVKWDELTEEEKKKLEADKKIFDTIMTAICIVFFASLVIFFIVKFVSSCGLNDNPPDYIKEVVAYKEGADGIIIYFILADASGAMTTSDGKVSLTISETYIDFSFQSYEFVERDRELYSLTFDVEKSDFQKATVGMGTFEREVILYPFGRVKYSSFTKKPSEITGKVKIEFQRPDGRVLSNERIVFF